MRIVWLAAFLALTAAARAEPAARSEGELACGDPLAAADTAASLKRRFGAGVKKLRLHGAEGEDLNALAVFADDKTRRLDMVFADAGRTRAVGYYLPAERSQWTVAGLSPGASVQAVEAANGGPFAISGFDWDNGGEIIDFRKGALQKLPGGCTLTIRFELEGDAPKDMIGDSVSIASTDKRLRAGAKVSSIMVNFPARR